MDFWALLEEIIKVTWEIFCVEKINRDKMEKMV
jgi:hypothetical protein